MSECGKLRERKVSGAEMEVWWRAYLSQSRDEAVEHAKITLGRTIHVIVVASMFVFNHCIVVLDENIVTRSLDAQRIPFCSLC